MRRYPIGPALRVMAIAIATLGAACVQDDGPETAEDFARRSCSAVVGEADIPENETLEQDQVRQQKETADAVRAAELDAKWRNLADAQKVLLRKNEGDAVADDQLDAAVDNLIADCEQFRQ